MPVEPFPIQPPPSSQVDRLHTTEDQTESHFIGIFFSGGESVVRYLYRGDYRPPHEIFPENGGFKAWGNDTDLGAHAAGGTCHEPKSATSAYVATSADKQVAFTYGNIPPTGFVYQIEHPEKGVINVHEALLIEMTTAKGNSVSSTVLQWAQHEREYAWPHQIESHYIRGVWPIKENKKGIMEYQAFVPNPNYIEPVIRTAQVVLKDVGRLFVGAAIMVDGIALTQAYNYSQKSGSYDGLFIETARVVGGWSGAVAVGTAFAKTGVAIGARFGGYGALAGGAIGGLIGSVVGSMGGSELALQTAKTQFPCVPDRLSQQTVARNDALSSLTRYALHQSAFNPQIPSLFQSSIESRYDREKRKENAIRDSISFLSVYTDAFSIRQAFARAEQSLGCGESLSLYEFLSTLHLTGLVRSYNNVHPFQPISLLVGDCGVTGGVENEVSVIADLPNSKTHATADVYYLCLPHNVRRAIIEDKHLPWIRGGFSPPAHCARTPGHTFRPEMIHRVMHEVWNGYDKQGTYPFFSLHFNKEGYLYPIIHPIYQNTLTGETISLLDNWLKSYLNGFVYAANYLKRWHEERNLDEHVLAQNTQRLADYFKSSGKRYHSLRELMSRSGIDLDESTGITGHYNQPFQVAFRIIATNQVQRHGAILLFRPDFRIEYDITPMPDRKAALESYRAVHGCYPEYYEKTQLLYAAFAEKIKEDLPLLPESESYFSVLGLVNSLCYAFTTMKTMGLAPIIPAVPDAHYAVPKAFPPIPVEYFKTVEVNLSLGVLLQWLIAHPEACTQANAIFMAWFKDDNTRKVRECFQDNSAYAKLLQKCVDDYRAVLKNIFKTAAQDLIYAQFSKHGLASQEAVNPDEIEQFADNTLQCLTQIHTKIGSELFEKVGMLITRSNGFWANWTLADITEKLQTRFSENISKMSQDWESLSNEKILEALLKDIDASEHKDLKDFLAQVPSHRYKEAAIYLLTTYFESPLEQIKAWVHTYVNELSKNTRLSENVLLEKYTHVSKQPHATLNKTKVSGGTCLEMPSTESLPIDDVELLVSVIGDRPDIQTVQFHQDELCVIPIRVQSADVPRIIEAEISPPHLEQFGNTALHYAAQSGESTEIAAHLQECEQQNHRGATALLIATQNKQTDAVVQLIQAGANPNHKLPNGLFPLYIAVQYHDEATALALLDDARLDIEGNLDTQMTPLLAAMEEKLWTVALRLIEHGAVLTKPRQSDGFTAIHLAAHIGHVALLEAMAARGADFNLTTDSGATCLHIACEAGHRAAVEYLFGLSQRTPSQVSLNPLNDTKHTPLMLALKRRHLHLQPILQAITAHTTLNLQNAEGQTASMIALIYGMPVIADCLIKCGELFSIQDNYQNTYFDYLIRHGELSRIEDGYVTVYSDRPGGGGYCSILKQQHLEQSARFGQFVVLQSLMSHVGEAFWNIRQLLNDAIQGDELGFLRRYLNKGNDHCLHKVAGYGSERCFEFLLPRALQAQMYYPENHISFLKNSIASGNASLVKKIIYQMPQDLFRIAMMNENGLHLAVQVGSLDIVAHLFEAGAVMQPDKQGRTPLDFAVDLNDVAMSKLLLANTKHAQWPSVRLQEKKEPSDEMKKWMKDDGIVISKTRLILDPVNDALHKAIATGDFESFKTLANNVTVNARNARGETPLMVAARTGNIRCMEHLFKIGAHINAVDRLSRTALHHALIGKSLHAACLLHPITKNPVAQDREGLTPFMVACINGLSFIMHPHDLKLHNKRNLNAFHLAIIHGQVALIKPLIEAGFSQENVEDNAILGCTPLQLATRFGQKEIVDVLMSLGANPNAKDKDGHTILTHAVLSRDRLMMLKVFAIINNPVEKITAAAMANNSILIDECILQNQPLDSAEPSTGLTALHVAVVNDSADVVKKLLPFVPVDSVDRDDNTPLHYAAKLGLVRITKLLLAAGANRDCQNAQKKTPIDLAKAENKDAVLILLQRGQTSMATLLAQQGMFNPASDPNIRVANEFSVNMKKHLQKKLMRSCYAG